METVNVEMTHQEVQALQRMLDLAVKAGGLAVAGQALSLLQKVGDAIQRQQKAA